MSSLLFYFPHVACVDLEYWLCVYICNHGLCLCCAKAQVHKEVIILLVRDSLTALFRFFNVHLKNTQLHHPSMDGVGLSRPGVSETKFHLG